MWVHILFEIHYVTFILDEFLFYIFFCSRVCECCGAGDNHSAAERVACSCTFGPRDSPCSKHSLFLLYIMNLYWIFLIWFFIQFMWVCNLCLHMTINKPSIKREYIHIYEYIHQLFMVIDIFVTFPITSIPLIVFVETPNIFFPACCWLPFFSFFQNVSQQLQTYVPEPAQIMLERGVTREYLGDIREGNLYTKHYLIF